MDHNPFLNKQALQDEKPATDRGRIEYPADMVNIPWQTRPAPPTDYELRLTDALSEIFDKDIDTIPGIVAALNERGLSMPDGKPWTDETFESEMKRLAG